MHIWTKAYHGVPRCYQIWALKKKKKKKLARRLQNKNYGELAQCSFLRSSHMGEYERWTFSGVSCRANGELRLIRKQIQEEFVDHTRNRYIYATEMEFFDTVRYEY